MQSPAAAKAAPVTDEVCDELRSAFTPRSEENDWTTDVVDGEQGTGDAFEDDGDGDGGGGGDQKTRLEDGQALRRSGTGAAAEAPGEASEEDAVEVAGIGGENARDTDHDTFAAASRPGCDRGDGSTPGRAKLRAGVPSAGDENAEVNRGNNKGDTNHAKRVESGVDEDVASSANDEDNGGGRASFVGDVKGAKEDAGGGGGQQRSTKKKHKRKKKKKRPEGGGDEEGESKGQGARKEEGAARERSGAMLQGCRNRAGEKKSDGVGGRETAPAGSDDRSALVCNALPGVVGDVPAVLAGSGDGGRSSKNTKRRKKGAGRDGGKGGDALRTNSGDKDRGAPPEVAEDTALMVPAKKRRKTKGNASMRDRKPPGRAEERQGGGKRGDIDG